MWWLWHSSFTSLKRVKSHASDIFLRSIMRPWEFSPIITARKMSISLPLGILSYMCSRLSLLSSVRIQIVFNHVKKLHFQTFTHSIQQSNGSLILFGFFIIINLFFCFFNNSSVIQHFKVLFYAFFIVKYDLSISFLYIVIC